MTKISRNAPCPCGSGKKYKKCCLSLKEAETREQRKISEQNIKNAHMEIDALDELSNSVLDYIKAKEFDKAESVCNDLMKKYPDQIDGIERMAMVCEARGENIKASEYYIKTAEFMRSNPGFDEEGIQWALDKAEKLKA
jgi:Tfp pilus assembly protein PilF